MGKKSRIEENELKDLLDKIAKVKRDKLGENIPILVFRAIRHFVAFYSKDLLGEKATNILFVNAGRALGTEIGERLYSPDLRKYVKNVASFVEEEKIGVLKVVKTTENKIVFQLDECITCSGMDNIGKRICHFEVGLVAGVVEKFLDRKVLAEETKCNANGEGVCEVTVYL